MKKSPVKSLRDEDDDESESRSAKAKRVSFDVPVADVDIKLAKKLDSLLKISPNTRPKFLTNKTKPPVQATSNIQDANKLVRDQIKPEKLTPRNLTKEELHQRVLKKYDTLVSENDPIRPKVNVKFLSTSESIELGRDQAKRQMERQLELNSISGNQAAIKNGLQGFRFKDGYEMPDRYFSNQNASPMVPSASKNPGGSILKQSNDTPNLSKSVTFARENPDKTEEADEDEISDDLSDSDCSTIDAE